MIRPKYQKPMPWNLVGFPLVYLGMFISNIGYYIYLVGDKIAWFKRKQIGYTKK